MDETEWKTNPNPYETASLISKLTFSWLNRIIKSGNEKTLNEEDLYSPVKENQASYNIGLLEKEWNKQKNLDKPSLLTAILKINYKKLIFCFIVNITAAICLFLQPILISCLLDYFDEKISLNMALAYCFAIFFLIIYEFCSFHPRFYALLEMGINVKTACSGLIYKKVLSINIDQGENLAGKAMNLISTDISILQDMFVFSPYLFSCPLMVISGVYLLINKLGLRILAGLSIFLIFLFVTTLLAKYNVKLRLKASTLTDQRIEKINEILNAIKLVKMFCWEKSSIKAVNKIRKKELALIGQQYVVTAVNLMSYYDFIYIAIYVGITVFISVSSDQHLSTFYVIYAISYYSKICSNTADFTGLALKYSAVSYASVKRIEKFLLTKETSKIIKSSESNEAPFISIENLSAGYSKEKIILKDLNLKIKENGLIGVIGSIGSGKTTFLLSILDEISYKIAKDFKVNGNIFYVSQEPFIFSASVCQNITFGKEYDEHRFDKVIKLCCLDEDIKNFPNKEKTLIGEKGINLSGGQRARINLARAVYYDADIYLLDDPLSAVDFATAKSLFDYCIQDHLKSKIVILVTHQIQFLSKVKRVMLMKNSLLDAIDLQSLVLTKEKENSRYLEESKEEEFYSFNHVLNGLKETESLLIKHEENKMASIDQEDTDENNDEIRQTGSVSFKLLIDFIRSGYGIPGIILTLGLFLCAQTTSLFAEYWLISWSAREQKLSENAINSTQETFKNNTFRNSSSFMHFKHERSHSFLIYSVIVTVATIFGISRSLFFFANSIKTSIRYHNNMLKHVILAPMTFFSTNPLGRIINRFSKDISNVDDQLIAGLFELLLLSFFVFGSVFFTISQNIITLLAFIPLCVLSTMLRKYYINITVEIKRLDGLLRSPVINAMQNTIAGLMTIRACKNEKRFIKEFENHLDNHTKTCIIYAALNRWFAFRLDVILLVYVVATTLSSVFAKNLLKLGSGSAGYIFIQVISLTEIFQWWVRLSTDIQNMMTSLERIKEYTSLENEPIESAESVVDTNWPKNGGIEFKNVSFRYSDSMPDVLKNLTFKINPGEKIGICGRTGAGKTSIISALFRMAECSGTIFIDDIDTKKISLHQLRSKISIIPQEPTLFDGSVRSNLDPFNQYTDHLIWDALDKVQLKGRFSEAGLSDLILKNGSNLSIGEKQLMCLARAMLRNSKLLVIDEATANVDLKTDKLVQETIVKCFRDCTVLTIAHRINTIIQSDRIMCLNDGRIENFDHAHFLINDENTILFNLINNLNKNEADNLKKLADDSFKTSLVCGEFLNA